MIVFVLLFLSIFAIILRRKIELHGCFAFIVLRMSCYCECSVALPRGAVECGCTCGIPEYKVLRGLAETK